jgi:hypothetical protein
MTADALSVERLEALLAEQSALRRVATLVAADPDPRSPLGGELEIESPAGGGTVIRARIALPARVAAATPPLTSAGAPLPASS